MKISLNNKILIPIMIVFTVIMSGIVGITYYLSSNSLEEHVAEELTQSQSGAFCICFTESAAARGSCRQERRRVPC